MFCKHVLKCTSYIVLQACIRTSTGSYKTKEWNQSGHAQNKHIKGNYLHQTLHVASRILALFHYFTNHSTIIIIIMHFSITCMMLYLMITLVTKHTHIYMKVISRNQVHAVGTPGL